jgi:TonB-dependent receptor
MLLRNCIFLALFSFSVQPVFSQTAAITGNIFDAVSRDGLPGAYVQVLKTSFHKAADDKGNFEIKGISPGEYDVTIENVGYTPITRHILLIAGQRLQLFTALSPIGNELGAVTVFGQADREKEAGSRNQEKKAAGILNVISSEAMARSPDINAANVLQRMSGITVSRSTGGDEAYAVIRGLEPRYNNTLLNGIKIASPDPKNRYVQLDIVPSDILSSIEISKSLTPDMEGDAIGGTINMIVKDAPEKTSFKATASIGYSQLFFDEKYINFQKSQIQTFSPIQRNPPGYVAQPGDFSRSNLDFEPQQAQPTALVGFSYTQRFAHDKVGVVLADNLQNQYFGNIGTQASVTPGNMTNGSLERTDDDYFRGYSQQLNNGLVAHLDYVLNAKNKINIDNFYLYSFLAQSRLSWDTTLIGTGYAGPGTGQIFNDFQSQTQKQYVENIKVSAQHIITSNGKLRADWSAVLSEAGARMPDLATINTVYLIGANHVATAPFFDGISRDWQRNNDKDYDLVANLDYKTRIGGHDLELKWGGLYRNLNRTNNEDDYNLVSPTTNSSGGAASKEVWTNIYNAQWDVYNSAGTGYNPNNYTATEIVYAEYAMFRYYAQHWEGGGGLRVENTQDNWNIKVHSATAPSFGGQTYQDFLPSAFFKYRLSAREYLHLTYDRSISRPNYYELVPATALTGNNYTTGNPFLQHSVADNFDIRYELFPKGEQHFFVGAFYKHIQNPIEIQLQVGSALVGRPFVMPLNSNPATNLGGEVSFTQYWGRFGVTGNYTYTHSSISSTQLTYQGVAVTGEKRPLQGQTAHIGNLSLLYKDVRHGAFAQLAYEYQGTTLAQTSVYANSDYYQHPMNTLAFSAEKDIHKHFTLFGKFNNLLNTATKQYVQQTILVSDNISKASYIIGIRYAY